jgi:predicted RNase H-like HicB family nuclease
MATISELPFDTLATEFTATSEVQWSAPEVPTFECKVLLCPEEGGGYSAHALRLPGVVSEGETIDEALENIADAFQAAMQVYLESGSVPWSVVPIERSVGCLERWILVNV